MQDEENKTETAPVTEAPAGEARPSPAPAAKTDARTYRIRKPMRGGRRGDRGRDRGEMHEQSEYEEKTLEIRRVTRVTKGGKRMRFRALSLVGNRKGRVGFGIGKGVDVAQTTAKAFTQARKNLITVPLIHETIPHEVHAKFAASVVLLKPAPKGTGIKAGGSIRQVLELAGIPNVSAKMLGSGNKVNNVKATFSALRDLRQPAAKAAESDAGTSSKNRKE
jgi:small subunit ribosomal protein S5